MPLRTVQVDDFTAEPVEEVELFPGLGSKVVMMLDFPERVEGIT